MNTYTWNKLASNYHILRGAGAPPNVPRFELELILPYVGTKSVLVKLKAWGVTQHNIHNITLLFNECEILQGDHPELSLYEYFKITYEGNTYFIKKFDKNKNPLTNRCTCASYFFDAAWYNAKNGNCLYGPLPRPYKRKTNTRPPRNPRGLPVICKHIWWAWDFLKRQGLTKN